MKIEVVKKDGSTEEYSEAKIVRVAIATGLDPGKAQALASDITESFTEGSLSKVSTLQIREKVIGGLKKVDAYKADLYVWYEKTKHNQAKEQS